MNITKANAIAYARYRLRRHLKCVLGYNQWKYIKQLCPHPKTIADIGAHTGTTVQTFAKTYPDAHIYAFEPTTELREQLINVVMNDGARRRDLAERVTIYPIALSDTAEDTILYHYGSSGSNSLLLPYSEVARGYSKSSVTPSGSSEKIKCRELDAFSFNPDIIKLDVQGSELKVLKGAQEKLKTTSVIFMEVCFWPMYKDQPSWVELVKFLTDRSWKLFGWYDIHHTPEGMQSYGDALFYNPATTPIDPQERVIE